MEQELNNILKWLRAYEITNHEYLDDSDLYDVRKAITTAEILKRHTDELDELTAND